MSIFDPRPRQEYTEESIRAREQIEQHQQEQQRVRYEDINIRFVHDPFWREQFWSIQHIRDVQEGKVFHWFWTPIAYLFELSMFAFVLVPFAGFFDLHHAMRTLFYLFAMAVGIKLVVVGLRSFIEWFYWFRFRRLSS
jgi:hypothetical protein